MRSRRVWVLGLLACAEAACTGDAPLLIAPPEAAAHLTLLVAVDSGAALVVDARPVEAPGPLVQAGLGGARELTITFVYFRESLEALRLRPGPVPAQDPLDPLPDFAEAYRLVVRDGETDGWTELQALEGGLAAHLYPHPEGCREVFRGGRELCVPDGCPGGCARDFCYEPPAPLAGLDAGWPDDGVSVVREGDEFWLYFVTKRWTASSTASLGRGDHAKVRLTDPFTPDLSSLTALEHVPTVGVLSVARPSVSRDGLELIFSVRRAEATAYEVFLSHRRSVREAFQPARFAIAGLVGQDMLDPLVLVDPTIVLLWSGVPDKLTLFRRVHGEEGSVDFSPEISLTSSLSPDPLMRLGKIAELARPNLSCDGWHLLLLRKLGDQVVPTATQVTSHQPLEFSRFLEVRDLLPTGPRPYTTWAEHPDCSAAYLSDGERIYVARRRPC